MFYLSSYSNVAAGGQKGHIHKVRPCFAASVERCGPDALQWLPDATTKKWSINGAIRTSDIVGYYYIDPELQAVTSTCLKRIRRCEFVLLAGSRASGKTTRLFTLERVLSGTSYIPC